MEEDQLAKRSDTRTQTSYSSTRLNSLIRPSAILRTRRSLVWALIAVFWLDWLITIVALLFGEGISELNPLGLALYDSFGILGLAGLKAWASALLLVISGWIRAPRAVKVLQLTLGFYSLVLVWNGIQLALFL